MKELTQKIKNSAAYRTFKDIISSKFFPFFTCALFLLFYYAGLDIVAIYYIGILAVLILLTLDDVTPIIHVFLFMNVMISSKNSPSVTTGGSEYFFRTHIVVQIIIIIALVVCAFLFRLFLTVRRKEFKPTPVFYGLCALAAAFLLNGVLSENYNPMNLVYGIFMAFFFLVVFALMKDNVRTDNDAFERIAFAFLALSVLLLVELAVAYINTDNLFNEHGIDRYKLMFGWGVYNTMGMLIVISIPPVMYLAGKYGYGYFFVYAIVLTAAAFLSTSRQAMIGAVAVFPICFILLLIKGRHRIVNLCIAGVALLALGIIVGVFWDKVFGFFKRIFDNVIVDGNLNGSGRWGLWQTGWKEFLSAPLFGTGFYADLPPDLDTIGLDIIPLMYHNTVIQLIAACGIFGLAAYILHRVQTVISFFRYVTPERTFIALTLFGLLVMNLFDNHIFYILPTLVYSSLIAVLVKSERRRDTETIADCAPKTA